MGYSFTWILAHLSQSFTSSLAVSASNAATASFVTASGVYGPYGSSSVLSSSNAVTASYVNLLAGPNVNINYYPYGIGISASAGSGTGTPGGPFNSIQFNSGGFFSGSSTFTFNTASNAVILSGSLLVSGAISASLGPNTIGFFGTSSWSVSSSHTLTASYVTTNVAGGSNTTVQFNDNGVLSGSTDFTYNKTTNLASLLNGGKLFISSSATSTPPLLVSSISGSSFLSPTVRLETHDGGGLAMGFNGWPSAYTMNFTPWQSGQAIIRATSVPFGFQVVGASTKLILSTDLPSFPVVLLPGGTAGPGTVEISGSLNQTGSVFFRSLSIVNKPHVLMYDTGSGEVFVTASSALGVTINNNTDNYLVTATGTTNTLNGESNLTFDGSRLLVTGSATISSSLTTIGINTTSGSLIATGSFTLAGNQNITGSLSIIGGGITGSLFGTASWATSASYVAPGGPNQSIQFNDNNTVSGSSNFLFVKNANTVILTGSLFITGSAIVSGTFQVNSLASIQSQPSMQINDQGVFAVGEYTGLSPTAVVGGFIYSGSEYYLGYN